MILWNAIDSFPGNHTDAELAIHRPCPVCGYGRSTEVLCMPDFQFFSDSAEEPKRVDIRQVQCQQCRALYLESAYTVKGFQILFAEAGCSYGATEGRAGEQLDWLDSHRLLEKNQSLLDVGCYEGRFLSMMPDGMQRIGVDIDGPAIERGRKSLDSRGVILIQGDFNQVKLPATPDTITMFHVLEHLPDPLATLTNLRCQASERTRLVVEVPILEKGFTNDINGFFSAQHMTHFSRQSLSNLLARAGWVIDEMFEQPDYNGCRVLAKAGVPTAALKSDSEDDSTLERLLAHWHNAAAGVNQRLNSLNGTEKILIWGGGMHTEFLYHYTDLFKDKTRRFVIVDSDPLKQGKSWRGITILAPKNLKEWKKETFSMVISSYAGQRSIFRSALALGLAENRIVVLYDNFYLY